MKREILSAGGRAAVAKTPIVGSASAWPPALGFIPLRLRPLLAGDDRLGVAAVLGAALLIVSGVAAARLLGGNFPALVFVAAIVVSVVGIFAPYVAVLAAILVSPTFGWATFGPDVSPFQVLVAGAAVGCLWALRATSVLRRLLTRPEVVLAISFVLWVLIAALARRGSADWGFVRNYLGAVVFLGVAAIVLTTERRRRYAVGAILVGCSATALVGLVQLFTTHALVSGWVLGSVGLVQDTYERLGSPWGLASVGSEYGKDVLVGFLLIVPLILATRRGGRRIALVVPGGLLLIALAMSGSRSAWLAAAVALGYVAVVTRRLVVATTALTLIGLFAFMIARPQTPVDIQASVGLSAQGNRPLVGDDRPRPAGGGWQSPRLVIGGTRDDVSTELSNNLRERLTRAGFEMVRDEPLFGVGAGAFKNYVDVYEPIPKNTTELDARSQLPAHNVVLEIWAGSGTPAMLLYVTFLGSVILRFDRRRRSGTSSRPLYTGLTAGTIGVVVTSLFHNYQYDNLMWALCGIAASLALWDAAGGGEAGSAGSSTASRRSGVSV